MAIFVELALRLGIGFAEDDGLEIEGQNFAGIAAHALRCLANIGDIAFQDRF